MNTDKKRRSPSILFLWMLIVFSVTLFSSIIFTMLLIYYRTTDIVEAADERLLMAAEMSREIVGPEFHDHIDDSSSISKEQFNQIVERNDDLCRRLGLQYIWSVLRVDNNLVFTSATHSDVRNPASPCAAFFDIHRDPKAFAQAMGSDMNPVFSSFKNEWGKGRMVLVPRNDNRGRRYIFGASVQLTDYNTMLIRGIVSSIIIGLFILVCACIPAYFLSRRMTSLIAGLIFSADNMADGDLDVTLPEINFLEIQSLSHSLDMMRLELKRKIKALSESESKYRYLYETMTQGVVIQDANGKIIEANSAACEILGLSMDQMLGKTAYDPRWKQLHEDGAPYEPGEMPSNIALKTGKQVKDVVCGVYLPELDEYRWIIISSAPQFNNGETKPSLTMTVFTDITERKKNEKRLAQALKIEAIGTLAGGIAHDFNNMLGIIIGNISYALSEMGKNEEIHEVLLDVKKAAKEAQSLTQQLLTFAKGGEPVKRVVPFNQLIKESADFVSRGAKSKCEFKLASDLWAVEVDSGQFHQVISNLVINADQAMPDGGIITIKTENVEVGTDTDFRLTDGKYVKFSITDQGIGIQDKHLDNIFDPYFTTKQKGSGLGLATTYSIIKKHGGQIIVYSEIGKGTAFHIYLPVSDKSLSESNDAPHQQHTGQGRILVMDDQEAILTMVGRILDRMGYESVFAMDGTEAIEKYQKAYEAENPFDLVILDLTIPREMGGAKTVMELLKIDPEVKAVVSSGYSNDPIMADYESHGFCGVLSKPYTKSQLSEVLKKILQDKH